MKTIPIDMKGHTIIVDDEDYSRCCQICWWLCEDDKGQRIRGRVGNNSFTLVSFIMQNNKLYDHKNWNIFDNRKENLRECTKSQNEINKKKYKGKLKFKGVEFNPKSLLPWIARINKNGRRYELGKFATEEEAAEAYNKKALELYGEFAVLNKI